MIEFKQNMARWADRGTMHPRLFEETVSSVFRDFGFSSRVTAYSGDGGIDVILESSDGRTTGIQVKRLSDKIKVDQIRALVGALVIEGHCAGVFVTTSDYQRGCYVAADRASRLGLPITLVSGTQFLEALRIANQRSWLDYDLNGPPFTTTPLHLVCYRVGACSGPYQYVWESETPSR